jgi:hypothetical protein
VTTTVDDSQAAPATRRPAVGARLTWLYMTSRHVPAALGLLVCLGGLLWAALDGHWTVAGGPAAQLLMPLVVVTGAAAVIAVTSHAPFGEIERAAGRWLPWLRLGTALLLVIAAFAALSAGATGGTLRGGDATLLRDLAGVSGIALLTATALGGAFGWIGPMAYWLVTETGLALGWTTPWIWPGRPAGDLGGALCAYAVFAAGIAAITVLGPAAGRWSAAADE